MEDVPDWVIILIFFVCMVLFLTYCTHKHKGWCFAVKKKIQTEEELAAESNTVQTLHVSDPNFAPAAKGSVDEMQLAATIHDEEE